jgi:hypothetical protein
MSGNSAACGALRTRPRDQVEGLARKQVERLLPVLELKNRALAQRVQNALLILLMQLAEELCHGVGRSLLFVVGLGISACGISPSNL